MPLHREKIIHKLEAKNLSKSYDGRSIVKDVSFSVETGKVVGLLGPNGAGKTTSFYMVVGLVKPDSGSVLYDSNDIQAWPMHVRARNGLAYLPQEASVFRKLTVEDNIACVLETLPLSENFRRSQTQRLLEEFNLTGIARQKAYTLSGGERRRVEVARALALGPSFLLLDEPFAGIDPLAVADIQRMIGDLKKRGLGVLITDHNVRETLAICDYSYLLSEGTIMEEGDAAKIASSPTAREKYLGENFQL